MDKVYQEMGEMIEVVKDRITDNEYLVMYNKLRDIKKLHDQSAKAASERPRRRWADSSSDSSSDSDLSSDSESDSVTDTETDAAPDVVVVSEETVGQFRQDVDAWATRITTGTAAQYRMRRARRVMNPRCRCGSPNHQRINHRLCPMNPLQTGNQRRVAPHRERGLGRSQRRRG